MIGHWSSVLILFQLTRADSWFSLKVMSAAGMGTEQFKSLGSLFLGSNGVIEVKPVSLQKAYFSINTEGIMQSKGKNKALEMRVGKTGQLTTGPRATRLGWEDFFGYNGRLGDAIVPHGYNHFRSESSLSTGTTAFYCPKKKGSQIYVKQSVDTGCIEVYLVKIYGN